ncbi:hypothetical protein IFR05_003361 [Cadophora sp. M221]|nr:hypothetical protein IFR05_003361 [Cadophora sp. M221]
MGAKDLMAAANHIWATNVPSWADYEIDVREGRIQYMDDPLPSSASSDISSSPTGEDDCSRRTSLSTSPSTLPEEITSKTEGERIISMLKASAARNREADAKAASLLPPAGLNPHAPAFAMRTSPVIPEVQVMKEQIVKRWVGEIRTRAKGMPGKDGIQRCIDDDIVAAAEMKKEKEHEHVNTLMEGLRGSAIDKPETDHTVSANIPAIIVTSPCSHDVNGGAPCLINSN